MGNTSFAAPGAPETEDIWWTNGLNSAENTPHSEEEELSENANTAVENTTHSEDEELSEDSQRSHTEPQRTLSRENHLKVREFKLEFERKHEKRRQILEEKKKEMTDLREEVARLRKENDDLKRYSRADNSVQRLIEENRELRGEVDRQSQLLGRTEELTEKNKELRISIAEMQAELQSLNAEVLNFEKERQDYQTHVAALKDVIKVSKQMLSIRENQLTELKEKVNSIEASLEGREMNVLSQDLRNEYERQLQNIRNLRALYEERQQADRRQKQELQSTLDETRKELEVQQKKSSDLEERVKELEDENSKKYDEIKSLESNIGLTKAESRQYQAELTVINQLFSEILLGFQNSKDIDLDQLTKHLEDHHDLLQNIVINEISSEVASALPKVLLDLVNQVNDKKNGELLEPVEGSSGKLETIIEESESQTSSVQPMNSAGEIAELLPKVWKVLIELLSHQKSRTNELTAEDDSDPCYKSVQTSTGPSLVISVSQTFIRLKDLILEKKSLEKEMKHLKHLNGHLENRLQDQEKRLGLVSGELSKTWHVVGKLQKQHQLLHTQEKILRYELAQKRKLLTNLKEELEYSREKWQQAREKNTTTEEQWKQLRTEFASRRITVTNEDCNNSVESGYSDERSSDDEPGYETDASESKQEQLSAEEEPEPSVDELPTEGPKTEGETEDAAGCSEEKPKRTLEEVLAARDERFRRLEGQAEQLVQQVTDTNNRSTMISNQLDNLHEVYGEGSRGNGEGEERRE